MSNHKRLKAAKRKHHNATAKVRAAEWAIYCASQRELQLAEMQRRRIEEWIVKVDPPLPKDAIEQLLDSCLASDLPLGNLWYSNPSIDTLGIAARIIELAEESNNGKK